MPVVPRILGGSVDPDKSVLNAGGFVGVDPVYQQYANETDAPLEGERVGAALEEAEAEEQEAEGQVLEGQEAEEQEAEGQEAPKHVAGPVGP